MRKAVLIVLALLALRLLPGAMRREARALELLTLLFQVTLAATANTSKAVSTEQRAAALEVATGAIKTSVAAIQTQLTGSTGTALPAGAPTGGPNQVQSGLATTDSSSYPTGQTSGPSAGTAHTHDYGGHWHVLNFNLPIATHTHDFDGHTHPL